MVPVALNSNRTHQSMGIDITSLEGSLILCPFSKNSNRFSFRADELLNHKFLIRFTVQSKFPPLELALSPIFKSNWLLP